MTGDTTTVLIGLAVISAVLPLGMLLLARVEQGIERQHPDRPLARADVPTPRPAVVPGEATADIPAQTGRRSPADGPRRRTAGTG